MGPISTDGTDCRGIQSLALLLLAIPPGTLNGVHYVMVNAWNTIKDTALWWSPIVAGFIGAFGVHLLTQSRDREKWILDNKKQEYRELLSAMSDSYIATMTPATSGTGNRELWYDCLAKRNQSLRLFSDRILIVKELDLPLLMNRWGTAMSKYDTHRDVAYLDAEYERIRDEIVAAANRAAPKTTLQRLQFWKD